MNEIILRPLYLVPNVRVDVDWDDDFEAPAGVAPTGKNAFVIKINRKLAAELFAKSALFKKIPFEWFLSGLMYHEVAHIKYDSHSVKPTIVTDFMRYIYNVLLDAQIEYNIGIDHPEASQYIRFALIGLRKDTDIRVLDRIKGGEKLIQLNDTFFYLTRFGIILENSDQDFVNFLLPILLSAQRNKVQNVVNAANLVYEYFFAEADSEELRDGLEELTLESRSMTEQDLEALASDGKDQLVLIASGLKELVEEVQASPSLLKMPGIGRSEQKIELVEQDDSYYRQVVEKHREKIEHIRRAFKRKINKTIRVSAFDGELEIHNQNQAYVDSYTGDERKLYSVSKFADRSIDHLLIRDISGSTSGFKNEYAEACIILHAAIQGFASIRDAHIDFSDDAVILLDFDKPLKTARIHPRDEWGTYIAPAYDLALKMKWKSKIKLITVVTDGGISGDYEHLEKQLLSRGIRIKKYHVGPLKSAKKNLQMTSIGTFHIDIAKYILREI